MHLPQTSDLIFWFVTAAFVLGAPILALLWIYVRARRVRQTRQLLHLDNPTAPTDKTTKEYADRVGIFSVNQLAPSNTLPTLRCGTDRLPKNRDTNTITYCGLIVATASPRITDKPKQVTCSWCIDVMQEREDTEDATVRLNSPGREHSLEEVTRDLTKD